MMIKPMSLPILAILLSSFGVGAFTPLQPCVKKTFVTLRSTYERTVDKDVNDWLETVAHKLRLQVYDLDTGVYGFESKDPDYGIETIRTYLHMEEENMDRLGLELIEVAHGNVDHRGLVLVSAILDQEVSETKPIQKGDAIVGVFVGEHFKESTTGLDYDETIDVLNRAKEYAKSIGGTTISLELNRLVKRGTINVLVEDETGNPAVDIQAKAGDNLRTLLMHHHAAVYGSGKNALHRRDQPTLTGDCGGEGICGTCLVKVNEGMSHLNALGPQEFSILKGRPESWRASCKTVVGADNEDGTTLRIRLHPWISSPTEERLQM
jgi:ferredoxin